MNPNLIQGLSVVLLPKGAGSCYTNTTIVATTVLNQLVPLPPTVINSTFFTLQHTVSVPHVVLEQAFVNVTCGMRCDC